VTSGARKTPPRARSNSRRVPCVCGDDARSGRKATGRPLEPVSNDGPREMAAPRRRPDLQSAGGNHAARQNSAYASAPIPDAGLRETGGPRPFLPCSLVTRHPVPASTAFAEPPAVTRAALGTSSQGTHAATPRSAPLPSVPPASSLRRFVASSYAHPANHALRNAKMSGTAIPGTPSKSARGSCANQADKKAKMSGTCT